MTKIKVWQPAGADERFAPGCFDSSIGKRIPFKIEDTPVPGVTCKLLAAEVDGDGRGASLTLELPDGVSEKLIGRERSASFSLADEDPSR